MQRQLSQEHNGGVEILCSQCGAPMTCEPKGGCWCADLPRVLPVPEKQGEGCLCRACLLRKLELLGERPSQTP